MGHRPRPKRGISLPFLGIALAAAGTVACARPADTAARFVATPKRVERGRYLANAVAQCFDCHSPVEGQPALPVANRLGAGDVINEETRLYAPNLTPDAETGLGRVPDTHVARAIREGIGWNGRRLSVEMPWDSFSGLTDEDVRSIVVYLRTLPPIRNLVPQTPPRNEQPNVPPVPPTDSATLGTPAARGGYLVRTGRCVYCHTPLDRDGRLDLTRSFSGGRRFVHRTNFYVEVDPDPALASNAEPETANLSDVVASQNLTPHPSGIPHYDAAMFQRTIRTGRVNGVRPLKFAMPWFFFRHMTDADLGDVFAYLKTLPPRAHRVDNERPPTFCPVCRRRHGGGDDNPGGSP